MTELGPVAEWQFRARVLAYLPFIGAGATRQLSTRLRPFVIEFANVRLGRKLPFVQQIAAR
ncbi:MAG: hypothetical protein ACRC1J_01700, partial [Sandaracinobacteroides sp.]